MAGSTGRVTLVTPAHARDLERFCFQRESVARCGVAIAHVAIVDHEDLPRFRDVPNQAGLTLVSTREALSRRMEQRRLAYSMRRRNPRRWLWGPGVHGWGIQQLLKLGAPRVVSTEVIVCADTDTFFVGSVGEADFFAGDGRPHLYETGPDDLDAEMAEWPAHSMRFLGIKPTGKPLRRYTHSPVVFRRDVLLDLQQYIERRHRRPWMEAVADAEMAMEYTTYGVFAREVDGLSRVAPTMPPLSAYFWWPEQVARLEQTFLDQVCASGVRIVGIQSNTGCPVSRYRPLARHAWDCVNAARASAARHERVCG